MANDKKFIVKNGLETQNISFTYDVGSITVEALDGGTLSFSGDSGQLFSITDSLSGTIFSVNDISGIPSIEVDDDGTIRLGEFSGNILIGTNIDNGTDKFQVNGNAISKGYSITGYGQVVDATGKWVGDPTNLQGPIGYTGSKGAIGFTGSQGIQGVIGYTGSKGFTGSQGDQGVIGFTGSQGDQGLIGYTGSKGDVGFTGSIGYTGSNGFTGSQGENIYSDPTLKTTEYTAQNKDFIIADTASASFQIFLPASPTLGNRVKIIDGGDWSTNNLTINRNGSTIEGQADDFLLDVEAATTEFIYDGSTWQVYTNVGQQGPTGFTGSQGIIGYTGSSGFTGSQGSTGFAGSRGYTGSQGESGITVSATEPSSPSENDLWLDIS